MELATEVKRKFSVVEWKSGWKCVEISASSLACMWEWIEASADERADFRVYRT